MRALRRSLGGGVGLVLISSRAVPRGKIGEIICPLMMRVAVLALLVAPAASQQSADWRVVSGGQYCELITRATGENCVHDGNGNTGNNEACVVEALRSFYAHATLYDVETYYDYITLNGTAFRGGQASPPVNVLMNRGDTLQWYADSSVTYAGWEICAFLSPATLAPPPPPQPSPPPPSPRPSFPPAYPPGRAPPEMFHLLQSGNCPNPVRTEVECGRAAAMLGMADITATDDRQDAASYDPAWCYYESGSLKFNDGSNTGPCTNYDTCLCRGPDSPSPPPSPPTPPPPSPAPVPPIGVNQILVVTSGHQYCGPMTSPAAGPYAGAECIGDGIGNHGNNERCEISVRFNAILTAVHCTRTPILEWPRSPPSEPHARQTSVRLATLQMMWRPVVTT